MNGLRSRGSGTKESVSQAVCRYNPPTYSLSKPKMSKDGAPSTYTILLGNHAGKALPRRLLAHAEGDEHMEVHLRACLYEKSMGLPTT